MPGDQLMIGMRRLSGQFWFSSTVRFMQVQTNNLNKQGQVIITLSCRPSQNLQVLRFIYQDEIHKMPHKEHKAGCFYEIISCKGIKFLQG